MTDDHFSFLVRDKNVESILPESIHILVMGKVKAHQIQHCRDTSIGHHIDAGHIRRGCHVYSYVEADLRFYYLRVVVLK